MTKTVLEKIDSEGVIVNHQGERLTIEAETIVLALGHQGNKELAEQLKDMGTELYIVGDCSGVGKLPKAIKEGFKAGFSL